MKKALLLILLATAVVCQPVFAQETENGTKTKTKIVYDEPYLNEIYVEYGTQGIMWGAAVPVGMALGSGLGSIVGNVTVAIVTTALGGNPGSQTVEVKATGFQSYGVASLSYMRRLKKAKWLGLGCDVAYTYCRILGTVGDQTGYVPAHILMPMYSMNFYYFRREHVELYSGFTAGFGFWLQKNANTVLFAGHLNAFGVSAGGKHLRYHCEIGAGVKGTINMGIGYKF